MKKAIIRAATLLLSASLLLTALSGCGEKPPVEETPTEEPTAQTDIFIGGGPNSGVFYIVGAAMASVINENSSTLIANVESTGASAENMLLTNAGDTDFGFTSSDILYCSSRGEREYESGEKYENLRLAMVGYSAPFHIIVRKDSGINSVEDLKGKVIASNTGITSSYQTPAILSAFDITTDDYTSLPLSPADCCTALQDGTADAIIINLGVPAAQITDLATNIPVKLLDLGDKIEKVCNDNPYFFADKIPAGSYNGQDEDISTVTLRIMLACNKDVPDDVVYEFCDIVYSNTEELGGIHPSAAAFTPEMTKENIMIDLHPGAQRWLDEH